MTQGNLVGKLKSIFVGLCVLSASQIIISCSNSRDNYIEISKGDHILIVGNNLGSRMINYGYFETELQLRNPDSLLYIRNMADGGNTPGFRPSPNRNSPWAFPGAEKFQDELATPSGSTGRFGTPDDILTENGADIIIAFFGYNESFQGMEGLENYKEELRAFIKHTLSQKYNGSTPPQLAIVSPISFEDLSSVMDLPNGVVENKNLELYTMSMKDIAAQEGVLFVDAFNPTKKWYNSEDEFLTADGFQLNDLGHKKFSKFLVEDIFGQEKIAKPENREMVLNAVNDKNWYWHNDYKIPNGVHVYGRRYNPFGPDNYPAEIEKIRQMTAIRDTAIWQAINGEKMDTKSADDKTKILPPVETNYTPTYGKGNLEYLYGEEAMSKFKVAEGYKLELFASETEFPNLANPVQMSFDNKGRLWVSVMPTYPHYKPGDSKPNDKLIIYEDTDNDGKADKETVFADNLHLAIGFEIAAEGVYVSQGTNLVLLKDTNGDDKADDVEILLSGFDDHDTHHAISAFTADPSGAIYMSEGTFLHTNVETAYGPVRGTNGGFYRYDPNRKHLERTAQLPIPNPWGIVFDDWGQQFFLHTSGPTMTWMQPGTIKPFYGKASPGPRDLLQQDQRVRPTSGIEIVSSRHFPDEVQGDILLNNTIGYLGIKQHQIMDDPESAGYTSKHRQDLLYSEDKNFRPVDLEFAPDGSLYFIDWHNILIGHMQHNARDPYRDHVHGRIYRVTYPSRELVEPAKIDGATIRELLDNLKLPESRSRYRTRRELRGRDTEEVLSNLQIWLSELNQDDENYEHHRLEALWVSWGVNKVDQVLLNELLKSEDFKVRAAAARVLRYTGHQVKNQSELFMQLAKDDNPRVRTEAFVAASWLDKEVGLPIMEEVAKKPLDSWMEKPLEAATAHINGHPVGGSLEDDVITHLKGEERKVYIKGKAIYEKEGYCATCHQENGRGLEASGFPGISRNKWILGSEERLIKISLKGLMGPIEVAGKAYPGQVPMTQFEGLLNDEEAAAVLTYARNSFGNRASVISPEKVKEVRAKIKDKKGFYSPDELLKEHPHEQ